MTHEEKQIFLQRDSFTVEDLSTWVEILLDGEVSIEPKPTDDVTEYEKSLDKQLALEKILIFLESL